MLVKDKKYAVAVSDMQGWRISEFPRIHVQGIRGLSRCSSGEEGCSAWRAQHREEERKGGGP
jgi:hypothetical protein